MAKVRRSRRLPCLLLDSIKPLGARDALTVSPLGEPASPEFADDLAVPHYDNLNGCNRCAELRRSIAVMYNILN